MKYHAKNDRLYDADGRCYGSFASQELLAGTMAFLTRGDGRVPLPVTEDVVQRWPRHLRHRVAERGRG